MPTRRMKQLSSIISLVAFLAFALGGCSKDANDGSSSSSLNIYAWANEIPQDVIDGFKDETGIEVTLDSFDSNETMITKLAAGNTGYDIVLPSQYAMQQLIGQELLQALDTSNLTGTENYMEKFTDPIYDPGNKYAIPWVWGTTGIIYNTECSGGVDVTTWKQLFDGSFAGKTYMLDNMLAAYIAGLQVNGFSGNSSEQSEIEKATESLLDQKKTLAGYNSTNYQDLVSSGTACAAQAWSGTTTAKAVSNSSDVKYALPEEGGSIWVDSLAVVNDAPHADAAYKFLNYILRPEVAALATDSGSMATANTAAQKKIQDQSLLDNSAVFMDEDELTRATFVLDPGDALKYYQDGWTRIKAS